MDPVQREDEAGYCPKSGERFWNGKEQRCRAMKRANGLGRGEGREYLPFLRISFVSGSISSRSIGAGSMGMMSLTGSRRKVSSVPRSKGKIMIVLIRSGRGPTPEE